MKTNKLLSITMMLVMAFSSAFILSSCSSDDEDNSSQNNKNEKHEAVDLGLLSGIKWASMNVGALTPEASGYHFAWGETEPKSAYEALNYKWYDGPDEKHYSDVITKYNETDKKTVLELKDDAARANWGGSWRMPTKEEWEELNNNCTWTWTTINEIKGYKVTGPNGNSIFLPAAGYRDNSSLSYAGSCGYYWSSSLGEEYKEKWNGSQFIRYLPPRAYSFEFSSSVCSWNYEYWNGDYYFGRFRDFGLPVRAVCP